jgi:hypothetical protein
MALLTWFDAIERVDNLLLEMRHVQETIASQLHVKGHRHIAGGHGIPADILYQPLGYEDHYLWGRYTEAIDQRDAQQIDWFKILNPEALPSVSHCCSILATLWCPQYPSIKDQSTYYETLLKDPDIDRYAHWFDCASHSRLRENLRRLRIAVSTDNRFSANDDRLYEALGHLQLIKRDMLRDKLVLAYRAVETFSPKRRKELGPLVARFLVVRRAVLHSLHQRLAAFNDIVTTVEETLNLSMERDPPPTVRRRRDQGIYTTDLADNCNFIRLDIEDFFDTLDPKDGVVLRNVEAELEFIVHRYTREDTSMYRYDHVWNNALDGSTPVAAGFVQSSFWMPERVDLQPVIAHEIAHLLVRHRCGNLTPFALDRATDPFGVLLRQITYVFEDYAPRFKYYDFSPRVREQLAREIACDLIGVAVHRTSHVFAQFLELISVGSEKLFVPFPNGDIAQKVEQIGAEYITLIRALHPEWLTRLSLSLTFSRCLLRDDSTRLKYLEEFFHDGVEAVVEASRIEHAHWMGRDGDQREDFDTWFEMTCFLRRVVAGSDLVDATVSWLGQRAVQADEDGPILSRYVKPLPDEIVSNCLGAWLDRLVERPRMLATCLDMHNPSHELSYAKILKAFRKLYLGDPGWLARDRQPETKLFNHLIDIPWQTAVLTAHDFLGDPADARSVREGTPARYGVERETWLTGIHEFNWLGRDLYHAALEYAVWFERPPIGRLKAMNRWLISIRDMGVELERDGHSDRFLESARQLLGRLLGRPSPALDEESENYKSEIASLRDCFMGLGRPAAPNLVLSSLGGPATPGPIWPVADIGSQLICRFYPEFDREIAIVPEDAGKSVHRAWVQLFDDMAKKHMNYAAKEIAGLLASFFDDTANEHLIKEIASAVRRPIGEEEPAPANESERKRVAFHTRYGRILVELIRVAHYLEVRPERPPGQEDCRATAHHAGRGPSRQSWQSVFSDYLNVPIHARKKLRGEEPSVISRLVPSRSIRVDRFSQAYDRPVKGHLAEDAVVAREALFWEPWDAQGRRPKDPEKRATFKRTGLQAPLLGRFDHITLDVAKHTARAGQFFPRTPYFRRQQIGVPFAAQLNDDRIEHAQRHDSLSELIQDFPAESKLPPRDKFVVPLATINILLVQRSARLTFVERLIAENLVMRSLSRDNIESPYRFFDPQQDIGLLTDGWGDLFLVLLARPAHYRAEKFNEYVDQCDVIRKRFHQIITLRKSIFEDTLVVRSETSYTPLAIDTALLRPDLFRSTILVRFRPTRDGQSLSDAFEYHLEELFAEPIIFTYKGVQKKYTLAHLLRYACISGRIDYHITTKQPPEGDFELVQAIYGALCEKHSVVYKGRYGVIFDMLRKLIFGYDPRTGDHNSKIEDHVDMTATTIAEVKFPMH